MEINNYIIQKKDFYKALLNFLDSENEYTEEFQILTHMIKIQKIDENPEEFDKLLYLICNISQNHFVSSYFVIKIELILLFLVENIKFFSSSNLFKIFKRNKRILLLLLQNKILAFDEHFLNKYDLTETQFRYFFYPEIKDFIDETARKAIEQEIRIVDPSILENFKEKRLKGENDSYICELIRNDSVEEFITYINKTNFPLQSIVQQSIYETNLFLLKREKTTLIEYAAFFGSIQIFQFLQLNNVELTSSLWLYAIHGRNPEIIHLLEKNSIEPEDKSYKKCLKEAIKCHHNEIADYILSNYINEENESIEKLGNNFKDNINAYGFRYINYTYIPVDLENDFMFFYACKYNYLRLVKILVINKKVDINKIIV